MLGVMQWIVQGHGARTARVVAVLGRIARRFIPCAGYALTVGTCRTQRNGRPCLPRLAVEKSLVKNSSPCLVGMITKVKRAVARMISGSRRSLQAFWVTMGITTKAKTRISGVLYSAGALMRMKCSCATNGTRRKCPSLPAVRTILFQSVVSKTKLRPCFSSGRYASARCSRTSGRIRRSPCRARGRGGLAPRQTQG